MVHDGMTRRSAVALSEMTCSGTSAMVQAVSCLFLCLIKVGRFLKLGVRGGGRVSEGCGALTGTQMICRQSREKW